MKVWDSKRGVKFKGLSSGGQGRKEVGRSHVCLRDNSGGCYRKCKRAEFGEGDPEFNLMPHLRDLWNIRAGRSDEQTEEGAEREAGLGLEGG